MLESTSRLLSGLTAWTGVVVPPAATADVALRSIHVVGLAPTTVLAVAVLADGTVEKHTIDLAHEVGEERVNAAGAHLAAQLVDAFWQVHAVGSAALGPEPDLAATARAHDEIVDALAVGDPAAFADAVRAHYAPVRRRMGAASAD